jgi:hypothetical protein
MEAGRSPVAAMERLVDVVRLETEVCIVRLLPVGLQFRVQSIGLLRLAGEPGCRITSWS